MSDDDQTITAKRGGPRLARTCPKDDCDWRSFGEPDAVCPEHGKGQDQPDHPYNAGKDK